MRISDWSSDVCSSDLGPGTVFDDRVAYLASSREKKRYREREMAVASGGYCEGIDLPVDGLRPTHPWFGSNRAHPVSEARDEAQILADMRSEEHTSELQSLMRISYAVFCLKKKPPS